MRANIFWRLLLDIEGGLVTHKARLQSVEGSYDYQKKQGSPTRQGTVKRGTPTRRGTRKT